MLKHHIKKWFNINGKQRIKITKKDKYAKFINFETKIKLPYKIYSDFWSILVPKDNGKQNPDEPYK